MLTTTTVLVGKEINNDYRFSWQRDFLEIKYSEQLNGNIA